MKQLAAVLILAVSFAVQAQSNGTDQKLKMVIPSLKIRGVTVEQALMSIQRKSRDIDPAKKGITIIIQEKNEKILHKKVTFDLTNIPIKDAIKYSNERVQFKIPISRFGAIQHKLAQQAIEIYATASALYPARRHRPRRSSSRWAG